MSLLELIVVLAASPLIAFFAYGAWKFSAESGADANAHSKPISK